MTEQQIEELALKAYPEIKGPFMINMEARIAEENAFKREGYMRALQDINSNDIIKGWVARDKDGMLACSETGFTDRGVDWWIGTDFYLPNHLFPALTWESEPLELELIVKIK